MSPARAGLVLRLQEWSRNCLIDGFKMDKGEPTLQALLREAATVLMRSDETTTKHPPHWTCKTHGDFDAMRAVGCPECMRLARQALIQIQRETYGSRWEASQAAHKIACAALDPMPPEEPVAFTPSQVAQIVADNCEPCNEQCGHSPEKASEPWVCPKCQQLNSAGTTTCGRCDDL